MSTLTIPSYEAVLFPFFMISIGSFISFVTDRFAIPIPYTATMFVIGVVIGLIVTTSQLQGAVARSIELWMDIDSETLLLVFLPGLIFGDALSINYHLFKRSFWQNMTLAFPGVLLGAYLTSVVAEYIFPYGWSTMFALTFGSILSATDPVSVSALLSDMGAPPRLAIHITGESMLNDGSAIVFFTLFGNMYLAEYQVEGQGQNYTGGSATALFFKMSVGGFGIGIGFGMMLTFALWLSNRRVAASSETIQVSLTLACAYLCYYVADVVARTSGVIAVVFCGVFSSRFGIPFVVNKMFLEHVWEIIEFIGNTLLFTMGGILWGAVISDKEARLGHINAVDWGYLILLYVMLFLIRIVVVWIFFPINRSIGLRTNVKESWFIVWGGLRGAVAIALALALDSDVQEHFPESMTEPRVQTSKMFMMVGGISLFSLLINGVFANQVLRFLKLAGDISIKGELIDALQSGVTNGMIRTINQLRHRKYYEYIDLCIVRAHVSLLRDVTTLPELSMADSFDMVEEEKISIAMEHEKKEVELQNTEIRSSTLRRMINSRRLSVVKLPPDEEVRALREIFIRLLYISYERMLAKGEIIANTFVSYSLLQSLDLAAESVANGEPINDFQALHTVSDDIEIQIEVFVNRMLKTRCRFRRLKHDVMELEYKRALAFVNAHARAETFFVEEFCKSGKLGDAERKVLDESGMQMALAEAILDRARVEAVTSIVSHIAAMRVLTKYAHDIDHVAKEGLIDVGFARKMANDLQREFNEARICDGRCWECTHDGTIQRNISSV